MKKSSAEAVIGALRVNRMTTEFEKWTLVHYCNRNVSQNQEQNGPNSLDPDEMAYDPSGSTLF